MFGCRLSAPYGKPLQSRCRQSEIFCGSRPSLKTVRQSFISQRVDCPIFASLIYAVRSDIPTHREMAPRPIPKNVTSACCVQPFAFRASLVRSANYMELIQWNGAIGECCRLRETVTEVRAIACLGRSLAFLHYVCAVGAPGASSAPATIKNCQLLISG